MRDRPGVEVHIGIFTEGLLPGRGGTIGLLMKSGQQVSGNCGLKKLLSLRRKVANASPRAWLILHLDHYYGALAVSGFKMIHQRRESFNVSLQSYGGIRRRRINRTSICA